MSLASFTCRIRASSAKGHPCAGVQDKAERPTTGAVGSVPSLGSVESTTGGKNGAGGMMTAVRREETNRAAGRRLGEPATRLPAPTPLAPRSGGPPDPLRDRPWHVHPPALILRG